MADANYFKVSDGQEIIVADKEARERIDNLDTGKQDVLKAGDNITIDEENTIASSHPGTPTLDDTTSSETIPDTGGSFYVVDAITRDEFGHILTLNIKTVTVPAGGGGSSDPGINSISYADNILTICLSDGRNLTTQIGNPIINLSLDGADVTITYADGTTGLLQLSGDSEVTQDSPNFITSGAVYNALQSTFSSVDERINQKQDSLSAGENIMINGGVISAVNTTYTAGSNVTISPGNVISAVNTTYSAGENIGILDYQITAINTTYSAGDNIKIDENNVISAKVTTYSFDVTPTEGSKNPVTSEGIYTAIQSAASSVYVYKGACLIADLPESGDAVGDVWNLLDESDFGPAGTNIAWNGTKWQVLGGAFSAGENITISESGVISAVDTKYTAGANVTISPDNVINAIDTIYYPGRNITIGPDNVINATDTIYTAGENITIEDGVISASEVTYTAGENIHIDIENNNTISASHPAIPKEGDTTSALQPNFGDTFNIVDLIQKDENGHVVGVNTVEVTLPASELTPGDNILISDGVISAVNSTYAAGTNVTIDSENKINASHYETDLYDDTTSSVSPSAGGTVTMIDSIDRDDLGHVLSINTKTMRIPDASSVDIDIDDSIDSSSSNPVTNAAISAALDQKISEPDIEGQSGFVLTTDGLGGRSWQRVGSGGIDYNTTYTLSNEDGVITLTDSNRKSNKIEMDTSPIEDSTAPITSGGVYDAMAHLKTYSAGENITIDSDGTISALNTTYSAGSNISIINGVISGTASTYEFDDEPTEGSENPVTSNGIYQAIKSSAGTVYTAGDNITISSENVISSSHPTISTSDDTTSSSTPSAGDVINVVDSVTRDTNGHVSKINTVAITLPSQSQGKTYTLSNEDGVITLTDSDSDTSSITMDEIPAVDSAAPVTSRGIYSWVISVFANLYGQVAKATFERFNFIIGNSYSELRLQNKSSGDPMLEEVDFRLMGIPSDARSMNYFMNPTTTRDRQDGASDYILIKKITWGGDTSNIVSMTSAFYGLSGLESIDLSSMNTSKVTSMMNMFRECTSLTSLDLSTFDTSNVASMRNFLSGCGSLETLDISGCDMSLATDCAGMFQSLIALTTVITDESTKLPKYPDIDLTYSSDLTLQSSINIVNALPEFNYGGIAYVCAFDSGVYNTLSSSSEGAAAISAAESRHWTIASR